MKGMIELAHDDALKVYGFSKPPYQTPEEMAEDACGYPDSLKAFEAKDKEDCYKKVLPMMQDRQREVWSQTSDLD